MRRALVVSLCANVGLVVCLLVLSSRDLPIAGAQGGGGQIPVGNGDVNGDGKLDVSDGIWIINHVFRGGPEPVPIECPPPSGGWLPATGQTLCYDNAGIEIRCDSPDFPGQDGAYQGGCPSEGRFIDNGDGTVTDTCTGLMWQKGTADVDGNGSIGDEDKLTWEDALNYCESLDFAGHNDWRLPNVRELQSIADYGRCDPAIDPVFEAVSDRYWSSTSGSCYPGLAWYVSFHGGSVYGIDEGNLYRVLSVRGGL